MKGMLYKDLINLKQQGKSWLLIIALYAFIGVMQNNMQFSFSMVAVLSVLVPISLCSYDERCGWDKYVLTMPLNRAEVVLAKYLFCFATLAVLLLLPVALAWYLGTGLAELCITVAVNLLMGMLLQGVLLVSLFKFGTEKARFVLFAVVFIPIAAVFFGVRLLQRFSTVDVYGGLQYVLSATWLGWAAAAAAIACYALTFFLSCRIYANKEF